MPERPADWKGSDWWGNKDSLTAPHYDGSTNPEVVNAFKKAKADPETLSIMLTGRRGVAAQHVRNVLQSNDLYGKRMMGKTAAQYPHEPHPRDEEPGGHQEFFTGDYSGEDNYPKVQTKKGLRPDPGTLAHKTYVINKLVEENGGFDTIDVWDDRKDHIAAFKMAAVQLLKQGKVKNFVIHQVYPPTPGSPATVIHMPVKANSTW